MLVWQLKYRVQLFFCKENANERNERIAECSFSSAKIRNISLSCKFLGDLLSILRKFAENKPDNLRKTDGTGDGGG